MVKNVLNEFGSESRALFSDFHYYVLNKRYGYLPAFVTNSRLYLCKPLLKVSLTQFNLLLR